MELKRMLNKLKETRNVRVGELDLKFCDNKIQTAKYNIFSFVPLNLYF